MRFLLALTLAALLFMSGCTGQGTQGEDEIYVVSDRFFALQMEEIMLEPENFMGRTIRYTGMFSPLFWEETGGTYYHVLRFDDCCGPILPLGFEVNLNNIPAVTPWAWVEVTGVLGTHYIEGVGEEPILNVISMEETEMPNW